LVNLLTNAAKYTPAGGSIYLMVEVEGQEVLFRVRDNGVGILPKALPRMFELFAQGDRSLDRSEGGLGIGLTLVKSLAELHGGTVTAVSAGPGKGSEFTVRLPAAAARIPAPSDATVGTSISAARHSRVLVVDDKIDSADGLAKILTLSGHVVRIVYNGLDAVSVAREFLPQFVLLDIGLPGMDGYAVAERLRREECCTDTMIIAVSGYGEEEARHRSQEAGIDLHMVKPVNIGALLSHIERR
jgi:CheY-like chemotaxis protein